MQMKDIIDNLSVGDLQRNADWFHIQEVGSYLSPIGKDKLHIVSIFERKTLLCKIKCTNNLYSEWLIACSNSMWKTQSKIATDIEGNTFLLGKMTSTLCTVTYL